MLVQALLALALKSPTGRFDLICTGLDNAGHQTQGRIVVDLQAKRYCLASCSTLLDIADVTSGEIRFQVPSGSDYGYSAAFTVNRVTGDYFWVWKLAVKKTQPAGNTERGTC